MLLLPVLQREMLVEARQPVTGYVRLSIPLLGLAAFLWFALGGRLDETTGSRLFYQIQSVFFAAIWCVIPLLTADALSQERRENTLGLLFLTGLSGRDIVLGKSCAQALRGLNLLLAIIPFQVVPVVLGGVTWRELVVTGLVNIAAILLALAAGMLASAASRSWWRAFPLALVFGVMLLSVFSAVLFLCQPAHYLRPTLTVMPGAPPMTMNSALAFWWDSSWVERLTMQLAAVPQAQLPLPISRGVGWAVPNLPWSGILAAAAGLLMAGILAWTILALAARIIAASWSLRPPSTRTLRWQRYWFSARFLRSLLRRRLAGAMNRNPVGWLHQRSWKSRLLKWGWLLLITVVGALLLRDTVVNHYHLPGTLRLLGLAMLASLAFTAATSFRHDFESGTMELLLVSPLPGRLVLSGRVRGIVDQYLPACALLLFVWLAVYLDLPQRFFRLHGMLPGSEPLMFASTGLTVIVAGLHQSLQRRAVLWAWLRTLAEASLLPVLTATGATLFLQALLASTGRQLYSGLSDLTWFTAFFGTQLIVTRQEWRGVVGLLAQRELFLRPA